LNRALSIDYGESKIGLALSDPLKIIAKPFKTINNNSTNQILDELSDIILEYQIDEIIIGLPITLKNSFSKQTENTQGFIELVKSKLSINVFVVDERLSSIEAKKSLIQQGIKTGHNKKDVDMTAAALFLQSYLDKNANNK
tara:strand:+ start:55 stop:477 length:423 start_codon:yes stop_codon:yes gene_type:complete